MKLALAGKGGVGKTTIAAALVKLFAEKGHRVFAVDADPDSNLGASLGLPSSVLQRLTPIVEMKDLVEERTGTGKGAFLVLNPDVDDIPDRYRVRVGDISLFRMGGVKAAGTQCYCRENAFLKALVGALVLRRDDLVVLDFGAGIEHLTRGTAKGVDLLLVVTEPTRVSADSAATMVRLGRDLGVAEVRVVGNKVRTEREARFLAETFGEDLLGLVPYDEDVAEAALEGPGDEEGDGPVTVGVLRGRLCESLEELYPEIVKLAGGRRT
ncbi:MAG TPA: carbon monoxide dehydrogenase [Clostridiales bacterium]|nr:carbon monoxide dehydrogenase [Clostridiales bacterium]